MKRFFTDLWEVTVSLLQAVTVLSYTKIAAMTRRRRIAFYLMMSVSVMCIIRLINWGNIGGEFVALTVLIMYLHMTNTNAAAIGRKKE